MEKVLFVFDGTQAPDMNSLIAKASGAGGCSWCLRLSSSRRPAPDSCLSCCCALQITEEVKGVLGTVGNGAQDVFNSVKSGMAGLLS